LRIEHADKVLFLHLTLVPYIKAAGEIKTKPTQHSVKELRALGIQPDILLCRCEEPLPESDRRKIALFTNVPENAVISAIDVDVIYKLPIWLHSQKLDDIVIERLRLDAKPTDLSQWRRTVDAVEHPKDEVRIAIVGKYVEHKDAYKWIGWIPKRSNRVARKRCCAVRTPSWCRAVLASAASKARSPRRNTRARPVCRTSASVTACTRP